MQNKQLDDFVIENINALLPQTQCTKCGYNGCLPYATAMSTGDAINKCIPGGHKTIKKLATLLDCDIIALDGEEQVKSVAYIREAECIGCTKCIQACPVDAIFGATKLMHTIIESECTGCDLCIEPCPVDCIEMRPLTPTPDLSEQQETEAAQHARTRYEARQQRIERLHLERELAKQAHKDAAAAKHAKHLDKTDQTANDKNISEVQKQAVIQAAIERARAKKLAQQLSTSNPSEKKNDGDI